MLRQIQKIDLIAYYFFGFASTFPNITERYVGVEPLVRSCRENLMPPSIHRIIIDTKMIQEMAEFYAQVLRL